MREIKRNTIISFGSVILLALWMLGATGACEMALDDLLGETSTVAGSLGNGDASDNDSAYSNDELAVGNEANITGEVVVPVLDSSNADQNVQNDGFQHLLNFRAFIDGSDHVLIQGNTIRYKHLAHFLPGTWDGHDDPTFINNEAWYPQWEMPGSQEPQSSDEYGSLWPGLPQVDGVEVQLEVIAARYSISIEQQPHRDNGFQAVILLDDDPPGGADWYEFALYVSVGPNMACTDQFQQGTLCYEDDISCALLAETAGGTCDDYCESYGTTCLGAYHDFQDSCQPEPGISACDEEAADQICICNRTPGQEFRTCDAALIWGQESFNPSHAEMLPWDGELIVDGGLIMLTGEFSWDTGGSYEIGGDDQIMSLPYGDIAYRSSTTAFHDGLLMQLIVPDDAMSTWFHARNMQINVDVDLQDLEYFGTVYSVSEMDDLFAMQISCENR